MPEKSFSLFLEFSTTDDLQKARKKWQDESDFGEETNILDIRKDSNNPLCLEFVLRPHKAGINLQQNLEWEAQALAEKFNAQRVTHNHEILFGPLEHKHESRK